MAEFWLSTAAGLHDPLMPLSDVAGSEGTEPPAQIDKDVPKLNVGVVFELTTTLNVAAVAHCPEDGVNV